MIEHFLIDQLEIGDSYERFEDLFFDFSKKFINEKKYLFTQNLTPGIQVIRIYCFGQSDIYVLDCLEVPLELQKKHDFLDDWPQFLVIKMKKEDFEYDVGVIYQFLSRNETNVNNFLEFRKEYFST